MEIKQYIPEQPKGQRNQKGKKYLETKENGNTIYQNIPDAAKATVRRNFIVINIYIKKKEIYQINNLTCS